MAYLIGVDIGTSGTKCVLFDDAGKTIASCLSEYGLDQPKNGWAEQNPIDWWNAVCETIYGVVAKSGVDKNDIKGIGLSGQMHGLVMLDKYDNVIRPSIIWCDQRTGAAVDQLNDIFGKDKIMEETANPALTGFTAAKIMWVKTNEPENFEKCAKFMLPKDYIRYMLTGEFATEVSDASGMQLMNVKNRDWSPYMLDKMGIDRAKVGKMYESYEITGRLTEDSAKRCGLAAGTPVVGGAGDQAAGAVGCGIVKEGILSATVGTSGVVFAHTDNMLLDPLGRVHTLCHAVPGAWHIMGVTQSAGLSFKWLRDIMFAGEVETARELDINANKLLDMISDKVDAGSDGLIYLPYLMGERTPHLDADARGVFFGLSAMHEKRHMMRAVLEGVTYSLRDSLEIIRELGVSPTFAMAAGGGANSALWRQIMADVFGVRIITGSSTEGGSLGAAILAGVGCGIYESVPKACDMLIHETGSTSPGKNLETYEKYYPLFTQLYKDLKLSYKTLAQIRD